MGLCYSYIYINDRALHDAVNNYFITFRKQAYYFTINVREIVSLCFRMIPLSLGIHVNIKYARHIYANATAVLHN